MAAQRLDVVDVVMPRMRARKPTDGAPVSVTVESSSTDAPPSRTADSRAAGLLASSAGLTSRSARRSAAIKTEAHT